MTRLNITIEGETSELDVARDGGSFKAGAVEIEVVSVENDWAVIRVGKVLHQVPFTEVAGQLWFSFDGETHSAEVTSASAATRRPRERAHSMSAPMPGVVLKILTSAGSVVEKGTPLIILEAMKMEHQIVAPYAGTVKAVQCAEGEMVQPGRDLIELEKKE